MQLDQPNGKNNGTVGMTAYFRTKPKHGVFVLRPRIAKIRERGGPSYGRDSPVTSGPYSPGVSPSE